MVDDPVTIARFSTRMEAELARLHLETEGFFVSLANAEMVAMEWTLGNATGLIRLEVPQSQAEAASALLEFSRLQRKQRKRAGAQRSGENDCLQCGGFLANGETACRECGWSYVEASASDDELYEPDELEDEDEVEDDDELEVEDAKYQPSGTLTEQSHTSRLPDNGNFDSPLLKLAMKLLLVGLCTAILVYFMLFR